MQGLSIMLVLVLVLDICIYFFQPFNSFSAKM